MSKKSIWYNGDVDYVGATGVNTVREMAELAVADGVIPDVLGIDSDNPSVDEVAEVLEFLGVRAEAVPTAYLKREVWDGSHVVPIALDAAPGRGFVKVLGVSV